jgi:hypothetical protein
VRWLACVWLLVVGCFDPPTEPPYKIKLLSAEPSVVALHGNDLVTVRYSGELPEHMAVLVDDTSGTVVDEDVVAHTFTLSTPVHAEGVVRVSLVNLDKGRVVASNPVLMTYRRQPATGILSSSSGEATLAWPLHPELVRPCARGGDVYFENVGDDPLTVTGARSSIPEITIEDVASCGPLLYTEYCTIRVCFASAVPGTHTASVTVSTTEGDVVGTVSATVLDPRPGLDPTFDGGGVVVSSDDYAFSGTGAPRPDGNGIVTWSRARMIVLDHLGVETDRDVSAMVAGAPVDWIRAMRAGPPGAGIHALVVNTNDIAIATVVHLDDAGVPDGTQVNLPYDAANPYYELQLAGGRILAIGFASVMAMANGVIDTTYGVNGRTFFGSSYDNANAIDSQGRLYVALASGLRRLTTNGVFDSNFSYPHVITGLAIDSLDRVYVLNGNRIVRLTSTGVEELSISAAFGNGLTIDGSDRIYEQIGASVARYTNGVLDGTFGFDDMFAAGTSTVCPASGACYLLGYNNLVQIGLRAGPPSSYEPYVLRLAD